MFGELRFRIFVGLLVGCVASSASAQPVTVEEAVTAQEAPSGISEVTDPSEAQPDQASDESVASSETEPRAIAASPGGPAGGLTTPTHPSNPPPEPPIQGPPHLRTVYPQTAAARRLRTDAGTSAGLPQRLTLRPLTLPEGTVAAGFGGSYSSWSDSMESVSVLGAFAWVGLGLQDFLEIEVVPVRYFAVPKLGESEWADALVSVAFSLPRGPNLQLGARYGVFIPLEEARPVTHILSLSGAYRSRVFGFVASLHGFFADYNSLGLFLGARFQVNAAFSLRVFADPLLYWRPVFPPPGGPAPSTPDRIYDYGLDIGASATYSLARSGNGSPLLDIHLSLRSSLYRSYTSIKVVKGGLDIAFYFDVW